MTSVSPPLCVTCAMKWNLCLPGNVEHCNTRSPETCFLIRPYRLDAWLSCSECCLKTFPCWHNRIFPELLRQPRSKSRALSRCASAFRALHQSELQMIITPQPVARDVSDTKPADPSRRKWTNSTPLCADFPVELFSSAWITCACDVIAVWAVTAGVGWSMWDSSWYPLQRDRQMVRCIERIPPGAARLVHAGGMWLGRCRTGVTLHRDCVLFSRLHWRGKNNQSL